MIVTPKAILLFALPALLLAGGTRVEFDPQSPSTGPFPSDYLTLPDSRQITGLRVNLPANPFFIRPIDATLNQLDGFSLNTRITVKFSAPIRPDTLRNGIFFLWLDPIQSDRYQLRPAGHLTPINEVVYDATTNTVHAKPDEPFQGARRYAILVTDAVLDAAGDPVEEEPGFRACLDRTLGGDYCVRLSEALTRYGGVIPPSRRIVGASLLTTLSATALLERARDVVLRTAPRLTRITPGIVSIADINAGLLRTDLGNGRLEDILFPVSLSILPASGVRRLAVASFRTPLFTDDNGLIPATPTAEEPAPLSEEEIEATIYLPSTPMPAGGYPVLVAGHGFGDTRFGFPSALAIGQLSAGYAVVSINAYGHGYGPNTKLVLTRASGERIEIPARGRGFDLNADGRIDSGEGCIQSSPATSSSPATASAKPPPTSCNSSASSAKASTSTATPAPNSTAPRSSTSASPSAPSMAPSSTPSNLNSAPPPSTSAAAPPSPPSSTAANAAPTSRTYSLPSASPFPASPAPDSPSATKRSASSTTPASPPTRTSSPSWNGPNPQARRSPLPPTSNPPPSPASPSNAPSSKSPAATRPSTTPPTPSSSAPPTCSNPPPFTATTSPSPRSPPSPATPTPTSPASAPSPPPSSALPPRARPSPSWPHPTRSSLTSTPSSPSSSATPSSSAPKPTTKT
ncbi:MAG: Ig-like domain-containing protein [Bryobacterales bacterium]|nr:Ig-like domain-containing protein [Bryobacterales bacterium]